MKTNLLTRRTSKGQGQLGWLESIARRVWTRMNKAGAIDETYDAWRRREAVKACGFRLSEAPKSCFDALLNHFQALDGKPDVVMDRMAGPGNEARDWLRRINKQLARAGLGIEYANAIAYRKCAAKTVELLGTEELYKLFLDVRRGVNALLKKKSETPAQPSLNNCTTTAPPP